MSASQRKGGIPWTDGKVARFWSYVERRGHDECWPWKGGRFSNGYGQFRLGKRKLKAHRAAYEITVGPLGDAQGCHSCDNPPCCNPAHIFPGTAADNAHDRDAKGRTARNGTALLGESNPAAKLTADQVASIRQYSGVGVLQRSLARQYGVSQSQIGNIVRGASWR